MLVGLFVLLLGTSLIGLILWLSTGGPPKDYDFYLVYMTESVSGLSVDSAVKYKGVNVGRVRALGLNPKNPEEVRILLVVLQGTPVRENTVATLELQGLTGLAQINLSGGTVGAAPLTATPGEDHPVILSRPSLLVRLDDTVSELLAALIETSGRLNAVLDETNREAITGTIANVRTLTGGLNERSAQFGHLLDEADALIGDVRVATTQLPELLAQVESTAAALESMAGSLADTGEALQATSEDLQHTVAVSGKDLRNFTGTALPEAGNMVLELRQTAANLRRVSETIEQNPGALLFGPPPPQPGPGEPGEKFE